MDFKIESLPQKSGGLAALQMYARAAVYSIVAMVDRRQGKTLAARLGRRA